MIVNAILILAIIISIESNITVGPLKINSGKDTVYVAENGGASGRIRVEVDKLTLKHNSGGQLIINYQESYGPEIFYKLNLLDKSISFTVELSQAGCGCNAALYLTPMPAYNSAQQPDPTKCGNYYCDANNVCGVLCPEIDLVEANNNGMQVTPHKCNSPKGKFYDRCDGAGCGVNLQKSNPGSYGWGNSHIIDTRYPFDVKFDFKTSSGRLSSIDSPFSQSGRTYRISHNQGNCGYYLEELTESFEKGLVIIFSYWGDTNSGKDMTWLDVPPCDPNVGCKDNTEISFSNFVITGGSGPTPPDPPTPCPEWQANTNYKIGTVVKYKEQTYTSTNDWNGTAGDPYTATHSLSGWGWALGGTCAKHSLEYLD